jgi:ribosomal protein L37AE/L43A
MKTMKKLFRLSAVIIMSILTMQAAIAADEYVPIMKNGKTKQVKVTSYPTEKVTQFMYGGFKYSIRLAKALGLLDPNINYGAMSGNDIRNMLLQNGPYKQNKAEKTQYCNSCHRTYPENLGGQGGSSGHWYCKCCQDYWARNREGGIDNQNLSKPERSKD